MMQQKKTFTPATAAILVLSAGTLAFGYASAALAQGAIAVADGERSGLRAEITELKRSGGDTVTLRFTLINESGSQLGIHGDIFGARDLRHVHLIDLTGMKKHLVLMDSANNCVCSDQLPHNIESGASMNLWARFPAPPAEVSEVSIVLPRFIPVDVPISE
jgi:hypothetical protein